MELIIIPIAILATIALLGHLNVKAKAAQKKLIESQSIESEVSLSSAVVEDEYQDKADAILKKGVTDSNSKDNMPLSEVVADPVAVPVADPVAVPVADPVAVPVAVPAKSTKPRAPRKTKIVAAEKKIRIPATKPAADKKSKKPKE